MSELLSAEELARLLHDLRSPLNVVLGYACLLEDELEGEAAESAVEIRRAAERLVALLDGAKPGREHQSDTDAPEPTTASTPGASILLVEDHPSNIRLVERILRHRPHLSLEVATDGRAARERMAGPAPAVVLCDRHLPEVDGLDLVAELGATWPEVPVCLVTADATAASEARARSAGVARVVTKPFSVGELLALLDQLVPPDPDGTPQAPGSSR